MPRGKRPFEANAKYWPTCPTHGAAYVNGIKGWVYCNGVGWHPINFWENKKWEEDR